MITAKEKIALNNCDSEPVHIPGRIQSFGAILGFDLSSGAIQHHSDNLASLLHADVITTGTGYEQLFNSPEVTHAIRGALSLPTIREQRIRAGTFELANQRVDVAVYATEQTGVVELEVDPTRDTRPQSAVASVRSMTSAIIEGQGVEALLQSAVQALRHLTGHDRVIGYQFFDNGDGEAIAEAKAPGIEPYLGLRYPAWDIPTQVRQVMLRSPFRIVPDIHGEQSALISPVNAAPLDLTLSHTRGVSPVYVEYIQNMGVRATLTVSLIVRGQLWGMFALHHYRPRPLTADQRSICELFGQLASMILQQEEEKSKLQARQRTKSLIQSMSNAAADLNAVFHCTANDFMKTVPADGIAHVQADAINSAGHLPSNEIMHQLASLATDDFVSIECLSTVKKWPEKAALNHIAGALVLRMPNDGWLMFFRKEVLKTIRWAGPKAKEISIGPNGPRLTPRGSFAEYKESVKGRCEPWTTVHCNTATEICREFWKIAHLSTDELTKKLERDKQYKDLLIAELNHRVRNTLALVRSIARQTTASSVSVEQYVDMLEQRITALSKAQDLIGASGLQWARIPDLINAELKPYEFDSQHVSIEGPSSAVRGDIAPILALLFHEMTSNAAKHGALSGAGGSLSVTWQNEAGGIALKWTEVMPQAISKPQRKGFGLALIERALPFECQGKSSISFAGNQLHIEFWLPADTIDHLAEDNIIRPAEKPSVDDGRKLDLSYMKSSLVVEDNMVLAMELERTLLELGIASVDTLPNAESALQVLNKPVQYDCAVLDINLGTNACVEVAEKLAVLNVAVVLASGYDSTYELPASLTGMPRLTKPIARVDLVDAIQRARGELVL